MSNGSINFTFNIPPEKRGRGVKSGDLGGHNIGPPPPSKNLEILQLEQFEQCELKWRNAPSCWKTSASSSFVEKTSFPIYPIWEPGWLSRYSDGLQAALPGFDYRQEQGIFLYSTASRLAMGPTQPPIQWVPGAFSPGIKRSGREADHSPPSRTKVKNVGATPPLPHMCSWRVA
jgi:hypothetical protein